MLLGNEQWLVAPKSDIVSLPYYERGSTVLTSTGTVLV